MERLELENVAFYGRNLREYSMMFGFPSPNQWEELSRMFGGKRILDCPSGPASFVAEMTKLGFEAIGCDPVYELAGPEGEVELLLKRSEADIRATNLAVGKTLFKDPELEKDFEEYCKEKIRARNLFIEDFQQGLTAGRYRAARLPNLPFEDGHFDFVFSSHLLFTYSRPEEGGLLPDSPFDLQWHLEAVKELIRVTKKNQGEIRVFALTRLQEPYVFHPFLTSVQDYLMHLPNAKLIGFRMEELGGIG